MSREGIELNDWCIVAGKDFRKVFFLEDLTLPQIENPLYDTTKPECDQPNTPRLIFPPKDLTGWTGKMDIREGEGFDTPLIHSIETGGLGMTIGSVDPANGDVELFIDNNVTKTKAEILANVNKDTFFDLCLIPPTVGEDLLTVFYGSIPIFKAVTDVTFP